MSNPQPPCVATCSGEEAYSLDTHMGDLRKRLIPTRRVYTTAVNRDTKFPSKTQFQSQSDKTTMTYTSSAFLSAAAHVLKADARRNARRSSFAPFRVRVVQGLNRGGNWLLGSNSRRLHCLHMHLYNRTLRLSSALMGTKWTSLARDGRAIYRFHGSRAPAATVTRKSPPWPTSLIPPHRHT